ncbi:MAG: sigma-70 family RNA polymerase sigma factor [Planctomycetes bacterium]|nr:sigma-70 family RNA polymerase sigma factor [Planctomycetota bacterium]
MSTAPALTWHFEPRPRRLETLPTHLLRRRLERSWVLAARHGDRRAFEQLWLRCEPIVSAILRAHGPAYEIDDLVQDVALAALDSIETLRDPECFHAWVASLARNRARDARRKRRQPATCDPQELSAATPLRGADGEDETSEALARVMHALQGIPACYRKALRLRLVEGLSGPEIAQRTGRSQGSLRVHLHRGLKLLRETLRSSS